MKTVKSKNARLIGNEAIKRNAVMRAKLLELVRSFFFRKGFLEVDTPLMDLCPSMEPAIRAFKTDYFDGNKKHRMFLQSSPEYNMKKLLASGYDNIYQITKSFRNGEMTKLHNPEFTILEWYRLHCDYNRIMSDVEELCAHVCRGITSGYEIKYFDKKVDFAEPYDRLYVKDAFINYSNIDLDEIQDKDYQDILRSRGLDIKKEDADFCTFFYYIFVNEIEPYLGGIKPVFLIDFPSELGSLARLKNDDARYVERFELYIRGLEICNAFSELNDYNEQKKRFAYERKKRIGNGQDAYPVDRDFLEFLKHGMPQAGGIAMGLDRLLMIFADTDNISDVILFPFSAKKDFKENV